jgi:iduronate 2-sulfatase
MQHLLPALGFALLTTASTAASERPNVLFIVADDLKPLISAYGEAIPTPHIDRIAAAGTTFLNAHCQQAVCAPSRASLLTGRRPDHIRVWDLKTQIRAHRPDLVTLPQHFREHGYQTTGIGKIFDKRSVDKDADAPSWSLPFTYTHQLTRPAGVPDPVGFYQAPDVRAAYAELFPDKKPDWNRLQKLLSERNLWRSTESADVPDNAYEDGAMADHAGHLLTTLAASDVPFFFAIGFNRPHLPFVAPKKYWDLFDRESLPVAPFRERASGSPAYAYHNSEELRAYSDIPASGPLSDEQSRELVHGYYAAVAYVDAQVGLVLDALETTGEADRTIVVLWGDHGFHLGDHGLFCKHTNFEQSTRSPLLIAAPGQAARGGRVSTPVEFVDLYPTLLDLAGLPAPASGLDGVSLAASLGDPSAPTKDFAVSQFPRGPRMGYALRTEQHRLVAWFTVGTNGYADGSSAPDAVELYDYALDPLETRNLATDDAHRDTTARLTERLRAFLRTQAQEPNTAPVAAADSYTTAYQTALVVSASGVLTNDTDPNSDALQAVLVSAPANGTLSFSANGSFAYTPSAGFSGADSFTYKTRDVRAGADPLDSAAVAVSITVAPAPNLSPVWTTPSPFTQAPVAVGTPCTRWLNWRWSDPEGGTVNLSIVSGPSWLSVTRADTGKIEGTPSVEHVGVNTFTVAISDGVNPPVQATMNIEVTAPNSAPVATADSYTAAYQTALNVPAPGVLANDTDADGDQLQSILVSGPTKGSLTLNLDGSFTYTPNDRYYGVDSFTYNATDIRAGPDALDSATVTVSLNVQVMNDSFPSSVLQGFQSDLGITPSKEMQIDLYNTLNPAVIEPWRADAEARIAQHRMGLLTLNLVDGAGQPAAGATVEFRQKSRPFKFGGILDLTTLSGTDTTPPAMSAADYKIRAVSLFDAFGLNNGLKPKLKGSPTNPITNQNLLPAFFSWAASVNRPVRGHLLIWPGRDNMSATVTAKVVEIENLIALRDASTNPAVIANYNAQIEVKKPELRSLVDAEITDWATRWTVTEWDVLNEAITNFRITNILGTFERTRWFQLTQAAQPDAGRLINDYQIISAGSQEAYSYNRIASYKTILDQLISEGAPVTGIGFQSRFVFRREDPALLYSRLEGFVPYGLPLVGTEFEIKDSPNQNFYPDERLRAQITEEVMTLYFSHPSVTALYDWSYCNPGSTQSLIDTYGAPKLNGWVWYYLNRIRFVTRSTLTADPAGRVSIEAFKGDYDLVVTYQGNSIAVPFTHGADGELMMNATTGHFITITDQNYSASADAFVRNGTHAASNFGAWTSFQLRQSTTATADAARIGYVKFTVPALGTPVVNAVLRLRIPPAGGVGAFSNGETSPLKIYATSAAWTESGAGGITWNTRPAFGALLASRAGSSDSWLEIALPPSSIPAGGGAAVAFTLDEQGDNYGHIMTRQYGDPANGVALGDYAPQLRVVTATDGIALPLDTDGDGYPDAWELQNGYDPNSAASRP